MNKLCFFTLVLLSSNPSFAMRDDNFQEDRRNKEQVKIIQERMEEDPTSTTIGGSRGGNLDVEKQRDDQRQRDLEKQKRLFESEDRYRRGL